VSSGGLVVRRAILRRSLGSPALFALVYSTVAAGLYFSLGAVAGRALGLTPVVFLVASLFFALCVMTYVEGASLHQERAGATVFARYAFNELVSFVAGWAILLDFVILVAITAHAATNYLGAFWHEFQSGALESATAAAIVLAVAAVNVVGVTAGRLRRFFAITVVDLALQLTVIVLGVALVLSIPRVFDGVQLGTMPPWADVVFALAIAAAAASTGLDASSGLAGEVAIGRRGLRRLVLARTATVIFVYVGISLVALSALPVVDGATDLGDRRLDSPVLGTVREYDLGSWGSSALRYVVGAVGAAVLVAGANASMLGLSRLAYSLATNRQIPSAVGRLHPRRATPYVAIAIAGAMAAGLAIPSDLDFLVAIYAFGAMLALTIAHLSVIVSRYREPERDRPYRMPLSVGRFPLPAGLGALLSGALWAGVIVTHDEARWVGLVWMALGIALYVVYRTTEGKPLLRRVTIPAGALRSREREQAQYGSILVPLLGTPLDDDIVQTAGRLAGEERSDEGERGAVIEALWVFQIPMSLPLDAALPEPQLQEARRALSRAKAVGEEYEGVEVATATVRSRRAGQAIVDEARRRGVEAIVLGAEPPSRIRGGALLGGRGGPLDNYVGDVTRHVIDKAPCRVILTAPPADAEGAQPAGGRAEPAR
jgi:APA family basic amino acid/polyamine antiporter